MATFLENLWQSVFTPGTTPTLLIATNLAFGALQIVLLALLLATYSIHFIILSFLCSGLWWSINWFAREVAAAQKAEVEAERLRKRRRGADKDGKGEGGTGSGADDEGEETETEGEVGIGESGELVRTKSKGMVGGGVEYEVQGKDQEIRDEVVEALKASGRATVGGAERRREGASGDRSGDLSTDSEWEKVGEDQ